MPASKVTVASALKDLNQLIPLAILSGLPVAKAGKMLDECESRHKHARNVLNCPATGLPPDIGTISASTAVEYLKILEDIAGIASSSDNLHWVRRRIFNPTGSRLVRTLFSADYDEAGYSELKPAVVQELFLRLDEIAETYDIPWDEFTRRLKTTNGNRRVSTIFSSPEIEFEQSRTLDDLLLDVSREKPELHDYQKELVKNFKKVSNDKQHMHVIWLPTGAGKTLVANECVNQYLHTVPDSKVLWIAPNWELLEQSVFNLARYFGRREELRCAGKGRKLLGLDKFSRQDKKARVIYTTLHTWHHGRRTLFPRNLQSLLVVCDESHWGMGSKMLKQVFRYYCGKSILLGLTATPRESDKIKILSPVKTYSDLIGKYLAEPEVEQIDTGFKWNPVLTTYQTFSPKCLDELGNNEDRNNLIVDTVIKRRDNFRKVLIFACNKKHADLLDEMLRIKNVSSTAYHSGIDRDQRKYRITKFRDGAYKVLVSVNMATHGLDIPDIDCIVLARPTESAALCSQMVGRGARLAEGKTKFFILDFTDNMVTHPEYGFRPRTLFPPVSGVGFGGGQHNKSHSEPERVHFEQLTGIPGVEGIPFAVDHTFGVEIELTAIPGDLGETVPKFDNDEWWRIAKNIIACVQAENVDMSEEPADYHGGDPTRWRVEADCSCGWEIIAPPLRNQQGFAELSKVCKAIQRYIESDRELMIDFRCGLHITLSTKLKNTKKQADLLLLVQKLESGLFTLVKPSRLYKTSLAGYDILKPNQYCLPVKTVSIFDNDFFYPASLNRYYTVNFTKAADNDYNLFEVRMHHGAIDYLEIIPWISLWMHIFNSCRFKCDGQGAEGKVFPRGNASINQAQINKEDIFTQLEDGEIPINNKLKVALLEKRIAMKRHWENVLPNRVSSWEDAGWYI